MENRARIFVSAVVALSLCNMFSPAYAISAEDIKGNIRGKEITIEGDSAAEALAQQSLRENPDYAPVTSNLPAPTHHYAHTLACTRGAGGGPNCNPTGCTAADGTTGVLHTLLSAPIDEAPDGVGTVIDRDDARTLNQWDNAGQFCSASLRSAEGAALAQNLDLRAEDLKEHGLVASTLHGPKNQGLTLINYNTNFWVEDETQEISTTVLGFDVRARATPVRYVFDYGDGTQLETTSAGYELGDDVWDVPTDTSHIYTETGTYQVTVTTIFEAEYSVGGGDWLPMVGTASLVSVPVPADVWRTQTYLVDK